VTAAYERAGRAAETSLDLAPFPVPWWIYLLIPATFAGLGALVVWRAPARGRRRGRRGLGAVADQLASGAELETRERDVAVLFVDLRGYTTYAEGRPPEDVFSTVDRFTEAVSRIVRRHGGNVVEFGGDGMMAVFGAPEELRDKERVAVDAGYEISSTVPSLTGPAAEPFRVGIGIATGPAAVGNVRATDHLIWTAIGSTTNLAARLQALTKDLRAEMVIDARTWRAAGAAAAVFERRPCMPIRGLTRAEDVYVLSRPRSADTAPPSEAPADAKR
jgi:class 3 adenylate cyclase